MAVAVVVGRLWWRIDGERGHKSLEAVARRPSSKSWVRKRPYGTSFIYPSWVECTLLGFPIHFV